MASLFSPISLGERIRRSEAGPFILTETTHAPNRALPRHCHERANVAFVLSGSFTESVDRRSFECGPNSLIIKAPGEAHANRYGSAGMRCLLIEVEDRVPASSRSVRRAFERTEHVRGGPLASLAMRAYREFRIQDEVSALAIEGLMLEWIAEASRRTTARAERRLPPWLERATEILHEERDQGHTLASIARAVGVHPTHVAREFRKAHRCTLGEYVRKLRVDFARCRLIETDASLVEIACAAGFADQSHFTRTFKRHTGLAPGAYRRLARTR